MHSTVCKRLPEILSRFRKQETTKLMRFRDLDGHLDSISTNDFPLLFSKTLGIQIDIVLFLFIGYFVELGFTAGACIEFLWFSVMCVCVCVCVYARVRA